MRGNPNTKELERAIESLISQRGTLVTERDALHQKLIRLNVQIADLAGTIQRLMLTVRSLGGRSSPKYKPSVPIFPQVTTGPNTTITDAVEAILAEAKKPLSKGEIVDNLRQNGVKISLENPKIVLAIAIKRDKKNRFARLKDGRVALIERK